MKAKKSNKKKSGLKPKKHTKPTPWKHSLIATHGVTVTSATPDADKSKQVVEAPGDDESSEGSSGSSSSGSGA